ncbi:dihydroxyacetone kinase subunit DhaK [Mycolicibacterium hippocampi]|uniref:Dihydroxyacetone kinase family protein n=1 Tax=Mycolicibacterium hippocampi TaxID=659824 RepID=A0A7I9ZG40_9MYCO|nr:dihydroxyacetone kinase subunit DhaK [Mycolicibacterium hippocampi]GFG99903.1 dihydroxyacetone kinase family protein [Mycolicibacterium hippocampi]
MTKLFIAERSARVSSALAGAAMIAGESIRFCADPAYVWNAEPDPKRRVALVSGGGAGHEPMHAGFVGTGGLDAACPGEIFTSPFNGQIYAACAKVALAEGVLQIVKNYTGDVLNFSIAAERLRSEGIPVEQVLVDEDWGSREAGDVGRRGTAATVVVEKVLGAAADAGLGLEELAALGRSLVAGSRTIAVAAEAHRNPDAGDRAFDVPDGELEYGVGIHGEPARERIPASDLPTLVDRMLDELVADMAVPDGVVVLVNGLGGIGHLELLHVADAVGQSLAGREIQIQSMVAGAYCTALDMRGLSLTLVAAGPSWLDYWLADHDTAALPTPRAFSVVAGQSTPAANQETSTSPSPWLAGLAERVEQRRSRFNALDQVAGDGDFGDNLAAGVSKAVARSGPDGDLGSDTGHLASAYLDDVGGSSGPLLGLVFGALAARIDGAAAADLPAALLAGFSDALTAVQRAGGAQRGDRTLVDTLAGIMDDTASRDQEVLDEAALRSAIAAAERTRDMTARRGRAAYVGDRVLGSPDPGAVAIAWLAAELWDAATGSPSGLGESADALLPNP